MALRNIDYSDRELLYLISSVTDDRGIASSDDIGNALGISKNGDVSPRQRVATRLSWMARYGFVTRIDPSSVDRPRIPALWALTRIGGELMQGKLNKTVERFLDNAGGGDQLLAMRQLTDSGYVRARPEIAAALRREWLYGMARRPRR